MSVRFIEENFKNLKFQNPNLIDIDLRYEIVFLT